MYTAQGHINVSRTKQLETAEEIFCLVDNSSRFERRRIRKIVTLLQQEEPTTETEFIEWTIIFYLF